MEDNKSPIEITDEQKKELLKVLLKKALEDKEKENLDISGKIDLLKQLSDSYYKDYNFESGNIVKWKEHLKNRKFPDYNEPIIILEVLTEPIVNKNVEYGSTYFNEKFDIKAGIYKENTLMTFYFDKQRFEPFS